jgi:hypothetical protein
LQPRKSGLFDRTSVNIPAEELARTERENAVVSKFRVVLFSCLTAALAQTAQSQTLLVDAVPDHAVNSFSPIRSLGAGVDRLDVGAADHTLTEPMLKEILASGWQPVTYRQNTELHAEAWHWNPKGTWSDPTGRGYFTGDVTPVEMIRHSFGYTLPHRGSTRGGNNGANYSRLTDGDVDSYWKSNPYLTHSFTGEDDSLHPQWVVVDLGTVQKINAIRIVWAEPYATTYNVQFWTGGNDNPRRTATKGIWQTFPNGAVTGGKGGTVTLTLTSLPVSARYLRAWMTASSNTCDTHGSADPRNCVGYAIRELYAGTLSKDGTFQDFVNHGAGSAQSRVVCSSVDPWHEPSDINEKGGDQVGFDFFYASGITRGLPAIVPVAMLYATPEDAAAEIAYLEKRHYPISYVELGEEPDGQQMQPEDYAALYLQWAAAIHKVEPNLKLGGPVFEGENEDIEVWPTPDGRVSWLGRFIDYLKSHGRISDLAFMSFEHYPYPCRAKWADLYKEPELIMHIMDVWRNDGLPANVPLIMSEGNLAAGAGGSFLDIMGALWLADFEGGFLTGGGHSSYFFHYIPEPMGKGCDAGGGTFSLLNVDHDFKIKGYLSQHFASQLITQEWVQPVDQIHQVFRVASDVRDADGNNMITAYAVLRPDGQWSLLVVNRDHDNAHPVRIAFRGATPNDERYLFGKVSVITFGAAQYQWHPDGANSFADPDGPPAKSTINADAQTSYDIPKASMVVIRGKVR